MHKPFLTLLCALCASSAAAQPGASQPAAEARAEAPAVPYQSALDAPLFYEVVVGELQALGGQPAAGLTLIFDAARRTQDARLFRRALNMALQARSGETALQIARAWKQVEPSSIEATAYQLQVLIALNQLDDTGALVRDDLARASAQEQQGMLASLPSVFARAANRSKAVQVMQAALADSLTRPATAASARVALGRLCLQAGEPDKALDWLRQAYQRDPQSLQAAGLALTLMENEQLRPAAEELVKKHLAHHPQTDLRIVYARTLIDAERLPEALVQLEKIVVERPTEAESWLVLGATQAQLNQLPKAEQSLLQFVSLSGDQASEPNVDRGRQQAFMVLAQLAERRKDDAAAEAWLARIDDPAKAASVLVRRASILARRGQIDEARKLVHSLPERGQDGRRLKLMTEVQLLRDVGQYKMAQDLLAQALVRAPDDTELLYEQSLLAEKLGDHDGMERLLRKIIALKPDHANAYNALGYSLAERNLRLPEARELIEKALQHKPADPAILDSLGWVLYRMGQPAQALPHLERAYQLFADAEIAAHLGEVLWVQGQHARARSIWREGLIVQPDNQTLLETLRRFDVKP